MGITMHTYAHVDNGVVIEIIEPMVYEIDSPPGCEFEFKKGDEVPIERRFVPDLVARMVDITLLSPQPAYGWTFDGKKFSPPAGA